MAFPHWEYFLTLDADLALVSRYVEFAEENFETHSVELVRLILAAGSEIDVVAKGFCRTLNSNGTFENINDYRAEITARYPNFPSLKITVPRYGLAFEPWGLWASGENPSWWRSHTNVKHQRDLYYREANLQNALNAVSGLFALLLYYYQPALYKHELVPWPRLLHLASDHYRDFRFVGTYTLPDFGSSG